MTYPPSLIIEKPMGINESYGGCNRTNKRLTDEHLFKRKVTPCFKALLRV